jgi:hypothetical protein
MTCEYDHKRLFDSVLPAATTHLKDRQIGVGEMYLVPATATRPGLASREQLISALGAAMLMKGVVQGYRAQKIGKVSPVGESKKDLVKLESDATM